MCKIALSASGYHFLCQRNTVTNNGVIIIWTEEQFLRGIKKDVRGRLEFSSKFQKSVLSKVLCYKWGINSAAILN